MFIDMHVHPDFFDSINEDPKITDLRRKSLFVPKISIKPFEQTFLQMKVAKLDFCCLLARDYSSDDGEPAVSNQELSKVMELYPDKFFGFASVDPNDPEHLEKLEYAFTKLKLHGLKLHPGRQQFYPSEPRMDKIYETCIKYNKPIMFHSGLSFEPNCLVKYSHPLEFEETAAKYKNLRICLAHFGWPYVKETAMLMVKYKNVYADTSMLYFDSAKEFYETVFTRDIPITWVDRSLRHQIMFGSNSPRFEQVRLAKALEQLPLRESTIDLIKSTNALEFLNL